MLIISFSMAAIIVSATQPITSKQPKVAPIYIPHPTGESIPLKEYVTHQYDCGSFSVHVSYRTTKPGGSKLHAIEAPSLKLATDDFQNFNGKLYNRIILGVSPSYCHMGADGKVSFSAVLILQDLIRNQKARSNRITIKVDKGIFTSIAND